MLSLIIVFLRKLSFGRDVFLCSFLLAGVFLFSPLAHAQPQEWENVTFPPGFDYSLLSYNKNKITSRTMRGQYDEAMTNCYDL